MKISVIEIYNNALVRFNPIMMVWGYIMRLMMISTYRLNTAAAEVKLLLNTIGKKYFEVRISRAEVINTIGNNFLERCLICSIPDVGFLPSMGTSAIPNPIASVTVRGNSRAPYLYIAKTALSV